MRRHRQARPRVGPQEAFLHQAQLQGCTTVALATGSGTDAAASFHAQPGWPPESMYRTATGRRLQGDGLELPTRRGDFINTTSTLTTVVALLVSVSLSGCTPSAPDRAAGGEAFVGHVHGLGVDPADGALYVASHGGVFRLQDRRLQLVAGRAQDTMGFTVAGPNHFLGSGHPDPADRDQPDHLGLIESRDAAQTWTAVSLAGTADFHLLERGVDALYGYDSQSSSVLRTTDQKKWEVVLPAKVADLAPHPTKAGLLLSVTADGLVRTELTGRTTELPEPTGLYQIEWPEPDLVVGISTDNGLYESTDQGRSWTLRSRLPDKEVEAFDVSGEFWHLATDQNLYTSADQGTSWTSLL